MSSGSPIVDSLSTPTMAIMTLSTLIILLCIVCVCCMMHPSRTKKKKMENGQHGNQSDLLVTDSEFSATSNSSSEEIGGPDEYKQN